MNYEWHYDRLIETRRNRVLEEGVYYERHHVLPRSMGGTNDSTNIVKLTAREHFLAHWLLWRIYRTKSTANAFFTMCVYQSNKNTGRKEKYTSSRAFSEAREAWSKKRSESMKGENHPNWGKTSGASGKKWSDVSRAKLSAAMIARGKQSPETVTKRAKSLLGKKTYQPPHTEETKEKTANSLKKSVELFENNWEKISQMSQRTITIIERYVAGKTAPQIAVELNMKVQTVRSAIFSAKRKLTV